MEQKPVTERRPRRWLRWLAIVFVSLFVLLLVAYFVGTSGWFLKTVILPKAGASMNARITVDDASISPFSAVTLHKLKVETKGSEPLLTADEVRAHYSLMDIIKGNVNVSEVALIRPVVTLITYPDGTSNLDPVTKNPKAEKAPKKEPAKSGKPPQVNLAHMAITEATIRKIDQRKDGSQQTLTIDVASLAVDNVGNDKTGKLALSALAKLDQGLKGASNGVLAASVNGGFDLSLDAALKPKVVKGQTKIDVTDARGAFEQAKALGIVVNADLTPTQLNDVSVRFSQSGNGLGSISASGPFDPDKMEGKLNVVLAQIDRQILNIVGAASGTDFNRTTIHSTNIIELSQRGRMVAVNGEVVVGNLSLTQKGQTTPVLDVRTAYGVNYDQTNKTALVQLFTLRGTQQGAEVLRGTLAKPMLLDLGKGSNAVDESAFDLVVTNFNLPDWKAFLGTNVSLASGKLGTTLSLVSQQAGKSLTLNLATRLSNLTAASGSNRIENADIALDARGTVRDFSAVKLDQYRASLARAGKEALTASGTLDFNTKSQDADVQAKAQIALVEIASLVSVPGLELSGGTVSFDGHVVQKSSSQKQGATVVDRTVTGKLNLSDLTGGFQSNRFDRFATVADLDVAMHGTDVDIRKCSGTLQQSGQAGGAFDVAGKYNTSNKTGQVTAKVTDLNQNVLKSFLAAALGDKKLESVNININTTAKLDGGADGAVKAELHVANLLVNDPSGSVPHTPLAVDLNADVAMAANVIDLKAVQLVLTKTDRAPNSLNVAGRMDLSRSNAHTGALKITSDGLDLTPYYELFAKKKESAPEQADRPAARGTAPPPETKPQTEPPPMSLPVTQFTLDLNIARIFLREVAISNLVSKATVENGRIAVNPFTLTLNGAPVSLSALVNVAVAGYQYDVNTKLDSVPVEPLVNTFQPEKRGQMKGDLLAGVQIKGAGITGPNLKKNLQGAIGVTLTNGDVQVSQYKWIQRLLQPLASVLASPELAQSPLRWIDAHAGIGAGSVTLTNSTVESSLFRAGLAGTMTLDEVLTNSSFNNLPVHLEFRRSLVGKIKYLPTTQSSGDFVGLPNFYFIGGTLGKPDPHIDKAALAQIAVTETLKNVKVGGEAGKVLRGFGIGNGGTGAAGATNAPGTNAPGNNLIQGLGGLLKSDSSSATPASTNAPATTNATQATNAVGNLLEGLGGLLDRKPKSGTNAPARRRR